MKQKFNFKPLPMLVAALTVADHFEAEKQVFIDEKPSWGDPFIATFREAVSQVMNDYYGVNTKEELQKQTSLVNELAIRTHDDLAMVKTQIERGFRATPERGEWVIAKLGFKEYWSKASNSNQSMLIGLLLAFRNNLDQALRNELEQNEVNPVRINNLLSYADTLNKANITQESLKGSTKLDTEKAVSALNNIYDQAMDICAIGQQLFKNDKLKKELFVFSKLVKKQGTAGAATSVETETPPEGTNAQ
ncbi:MAG: hypothetical protein WC384_06255 [Prolixibacteraceae bacterium]|jgi:hypothetical protein